MLTCPMCGQDMLALENKIQINITMAGTEGADDETQETKLEEDSTTYGCDNCGHTEVVED